MTRASFAGPRFGVARVDVEEVTFADALGYGVDDAVVADPGGEVDAGALVVVVRPVRAVDAVETFSAATNPPTAMTQAAPTRLTRMSRAGRLS
ncbi:MAG TPA: hypothetical protein VF230_00920 [Acidimicrobiales bacterium]